MIEPDRAVPGVDDVELRALLDETSELVCAAGVNGRITYVNRAWRQSLGYTLAEASGMDTADLVAPEQRGLYRDVARRLVAGEPVQDFEAVLIAKDGRRLVCRGRGTPVMRDGRCIATRAVYRDVTAERQTGALRGRLAATLEATSDFVGIATRDGQIVYVNRAGRRLVGLPEDADLAAMRADDLHPPEALAHIFGEGMPAVMQHGHWEGESTLLGAGGERIPVSIVIVAHPSLRPNEPPYYLSTVMRDLRERVRAEASVRESEARLRGVVDALDEGVVIADFDDRMLFVNRRLSTLVDRTPEELLGRIGYETLVQPARREEVRRRIADRLAGNSERYELELVRRDGSFIWVEVGAAPYRDGSGAVVGTVASFTDISERKAAERTIARERQFREAVLENLSEGIIACDAEGRLTLVNRAAHALHSLPLTPVPSDRVPEHYALFHADGETRMRPEELPLQRALAEGAVADVEMVIAPRDGTPRTVLVSGRRFVDENGATLGAVVALHDVTARKSAEAALQESEARFRSVLENLRAIAITLDAEGRVTFANEHLFAVTGWTREEVLGREWFGHLTAPAAELREVYREMVAADAIPAHYENAIVTRSGAQRLIAWDNVALRDPLGRVAGAASVGRDVTEERRVRELKDQLIATVSHELRNPLGAIRGALRLLPRQLATMDAQARDLLDLASRNTERLIRLTNDLLDVERVESGTAPIDPVAVEADTLIANAVETVTHEADAARVRLVHEPGSDTPGTTAWADVDRVTQVLTNLLGNAIKFSPAGARVVVVAQPEDGGAVRFTVRDEGRGIPADRLEAVFERFEQLRASDARVKGGAGLGLAISRAIVSQHGGRIWAESTPGQGSTFAFTLPRA